MLKNSTVTYVSEHVLPMSPVYTPQWERGRGGGGIAIRLSTVVFVDRLCPLIAY